MIQRWLNVVFDATLDFQEAGLSKFCPILSKFSRQGLETYCEREEVFVVVVFLNCCTCGIWSFPG